MRNYFKVIFVFLFYVILYFVSPPCLSKVKRIISLNPGTTEMLVSLGLINEIVAVTDTCNYPPSITKKEKIGGLDINLEKVIYLHPDLVVGDISLRTLQLERIKSLGINVLGLRCDNLADFRNSLIILGKITGKDKKAKEVLEQFDKEFSRISREVAKIKVKPKVFVEIWPSPLMTAGKDTFISELINAAGGYNIGEELQGQYPIVNPEWLISKEPEVIILTSIDVKEFISDNRWQKLGCVKNKKVYKINPDLLVRPTPRMLKGIRQLIQFLNPTLYEKLF